jgi:hypothetical protein
MGRSSTLGGVGILKSEEALLADAYDETQEDYCDECGGTKTYCDTCRMWSNTCCEEFGTCECS